MSGSFSHPRDSEASEVAQEVALVTCGLPWCSGHGAELYVLSLQIEEAGWSYVGGWTGQGGSKLGTKR